MAKEIERKYLIDATKLGPLPQGKRIKQAYIPTQNSATVRLRVMGDEAFLTLKGKSVGVSRSEFEYPIAVDEAEAMIEELCSGPVIDKTRYLIPYACHTWELDIFHGDNEGLIVAEIELSSERELFEKPAWVTEEVSGDARYYNSRLLTHPFKHWNTRT